MLRSKVSSSHRIDEIGLDVRQFTSAPLRIEGRIPFDVEPERVFAKVADHEGLVAWVPMMRHVATNHRASSSPGHCGAGSERVCSVTGMGKIHEKILWWSPRHGYAYAGESKMMPIEDHLGVMAALPGDHGGSLLIWRQYFNWRGWLMRHMFARMMPWMMNTAVSNLRKEFGGPPAKVRRVG